MLLCLRRVVPVILLSVGLSIPLLAQTITTIVSGTNVNNGGPATNAALGMPTGIVFDGAGNLYITDKNEHTIRKIDETGTITTFAGTGKGGFGGDGGPATQATFNAPEGITSDAAGNIYLADRLNHRVRKINTAGVVSTVAGTGSQGFSGDGGAATSAQLAYPTDVYVTPAGELLITDAQYNRVRRVALNGIITTIAGNGTYGFSGDGGPATNASFKSPAGIVADGTGNLYIADSQNNRVRKIDPAGIITTVAGNGFGGFGGDGGPATQASVETPAYLALDAAGVLYITQSGGRIRCVSTTGIITTVAGNGTVDFTGDGGPATQAALNNPAGIKSNASGDLFVADRNNYRVRKISGGIISTIAGGFTGDGGPATSAYLMPEDFIANTPTNVAVDSVGNLYVTSRYTSQIRKVTSTGVISTLAGTGVRGYSGDGGPATQAKLNYPRGVALDRVGNVFFVDQYNSRIRKLNAAQTISTVAGSNSANFIDNTTFASSADFYNSSTLPIDSAGNLYAFNACCVIKIAPAGTITVVAGTTAGSGFSGDGGPATNARLSYPQSAVVGHNNNLYISDTGNNRIRKVDANGIITTIAGTGSAGFGSSNVPAISTPIVPAGITRDLFGNLYVSEVAFPRVRKIDRDGIITTIAGTGSAGLGGDGGLATNAKLNVPAEITLDAAGNLYIADAGNRRVRKVTYPIQATLTAGNFCQTSSTTITAMPSGPGFTYQFGAGAVQIGATNQAVVSTAGVYSVTVSTSIFGSPPGVTSISIGAVGEIYTLRNGSWNDPTVWSCGAIPVVSQTVRIGHLIDIPPDYQATAALVRYTSDGRIRFATRARLKIAD